jgi:hypothetical protein
MFPNFEKFTLMKPNETTTSHSTVNNTLLAVRKCMTNDECTPKFEPFEWSAMQIAVYSINCQNLDRYVDEVTCMIERYADTKVYTELEKPAEEFDNKVLKLLKSMTLSMAAHPDCFKRPDGAASEFYDLVEMAEKVLEGTLDTRHG